MTTAPKNRTGLIIIIIVGLIIIGLAVWYFIFKDSGCDPNHNGYNKKGKFDPKCKFEDPKNTNTPPPVGTSGWISDAYFPIRKGSWGPKVAGLQKAVGAKEDGKFGPNTEASLKAKTGKTEIANQAEYDAIVSPTTSANPVTSVIGKKAYANGQTVKVRSGAYVNNGTINNIICELPVNYEPAPIVINSVVGSTDSRYRWYELQLSNPANCMNYSKGFVREDVITLK